MYKKIILLLLLININSLSFANNSLDFSELTKLARRHWYQDPVIGIKYADKALKQAIEIKDTSLIFEAKILLGSLYLMAGNFDLALDVYLNAENYLDINDIPQIADYNIHLASMYFSLKDSSKSNEYNDIALNLYKKLNDSIGISWVYNLKGLVYYQDSLFNKSEEYLNKSLELNRQIGNIEGIYINYNNLSIIPGNEAERLKILNEALGYNIKKNYKWTEAEKYNKFVVIYIILI